jgi:hypothetical protein
MLLVVVRRLTNFFSLSFELGFFVWTLNCERLRCFCEGGLFALLMGSLLIVWGLFWGMLLEEMA